MSGPYRGPMMPADEQWQRAAKEANALRERVRALEEMVRERVAMDEGSWKLKKERPGCSVLGATTPENCPCWHCRARALLSEEDAG